MEAKELIDSWKQRLQTLSKDKPILAHWSYEANSYWRNLTTITGYSEEEIAAAEARMGLQFPVVYRTFLKEMGQRPSILFWNSALASPNEFERCREVMERYMRRTNPDLVLPKEAVVFLIQDDFEFLYILGTGGFDSPVFLYTDDGEQDHMLMISSTLAELIEEEIQVAELIDPEYRLRGMKEFPYYYFDEDDVDSDGNPLPKPWWMRKGV